MTERVIGRLSQVPRGEGRVFDVHGIAVAVYHTRAGEVFASQAECPHRFGPLADGLIGDASVICPLHDRKFDLHTGAGPDCNIRIYPVRLTDDGHIVLETADLSSSLMPMAQAQ